jgi:hypothetical protein
MPWSRTHSRSSPRRTALPSAIGVSSGEYFKALDALGECAFERVRGEPGDGQGEGGEADHGKDHPAAYGGQPDSPE